MPAIHVFWDGDHERFGREVGTNRLPVLHTTADWWIDALDKGMASGATSLMLAVPVFVGNQPAVVMAETSLTVFMQAATTLAAAFRDEVEKPGWASLSPAARAHLEPRMAEALRRAIPSASAAQLADAVTMVLDGFGADGPEIVWPT